MRKQRASLKDINKTQMPKTLSRREDVWDEVSGWGAVRVPHAQATVLALPAPRFMQTATHRREPDIALVK